MFDCSTLAQVFVHEAGALAKAVDVFSLLSAGIVTHVIQFSSEQGIIVPQGIRFYNAMLMVFVSREFFASSVAPG